MAITREAMKRPVRTGVPLRVTSATSTTPRAVVTSTRRPALVAVISKVRASPEPVSTTTSTLSPFMRSMVRLAGARFCGSPPSGISQVVATTFKDYYATLGVPKSATQKEIKAAFRKLARQSHPDLNPGDAAAERRFKEINEAHEVLGDPEKRRKYDEYGENWQQMEAWEQAGRPGPNPFQQAPGFGAGGPVEYRTVSPEDLQQLFGDADPFSDFFYSMFGNGAATAGGTRRRGGTPRSRAGSHVEGEVEISLQEAFTGTRRTVEVTGPGGVRRVEVTIPPGITEGAKVRAAGQGAAGSGGGAAGDLLLRVRIAADPHFRREGDDLHTRVRVPLRTALLGGEVAVRTLRGTRAQLRIPEITQNGARLRLRGLGMPRLRGEGSGDLYAEVEVRLPATLSADLRALAEKLPES